MQKTCKFKFAGIQLMVGTDKHQNLQRAADKISDAVAKGAQVVALPECFNCPYSNDSFPVYAENIPEGPSTRMLADQAQLHHIYLIAGSFPERDGEKLYNTSLVFDPKGDIICKHRKVHLFDISVPPRGDKPGITFCESATLSPGHSISTFDTEYCKFGLAICYDIRFPEMAQIMARKGVKFICYPGAFNTTTGPLHWELLLKARALDNQVFVAAVSPARNPESKYQAWGHSSIVDPWAQVMTTTEHGEDTIMAEIDLSRVEEVRAQLPVTSQKRYDLYDVIYKEPPALD